MIFKKNIFYPPIIQSAIAGIANTQFCQKMLDFNVGMTILGGLSIDEKCNSATKLLLKRGRKEFLLPEKKVEIEKWCKNNLELKRKIENQKISINIRLVDIDKMSKIWLKILCSYVDFIEINAHCRQEEIVNAGGGEGLLFNLTHLERLLKEIRETVPKISLGIKIRGFVIENYYTLIDILEKYECKYIHIDAMLPNKQKADLNIIRKFVEKTNIPIIGNNSIRTIKDIQEMLETGAIAISLARPLIRNPSVIRDLISEYSRCKNE